jgi:hypothetical protein
MANNIFLVLTNAVEGQDDPFNTWYDDKHTGDLLNIPGIVAVQRYVLEEMALPEGLDLPAELAPPTHRYLVIYELDCEVDEALSGLLASFTSGRMAISDALDLNTVSLTGWKPHGERVVADQ